MTGREEQEHRERYQNKYKRASVDALPLVQVEQ